MSLHSKKFIIQLQPVDYISLGALFFSCFSVLLFSKGFFARGLAVLLIALLFDAYDGWFARKLNQQRDFGRYLDGGIDVITHLLAPAVFFYQWGMSSWYFLGILFMVISAGVIRLAVFNDIGNINTGSGLNYLGSPVFWLPFIATFFYFIDSFVAHRHLVLPAASIVLLVFTYRMVYRKERYKPQSILGITVTLSSIIVLLFVWNTLPDYFFEWIGLIFLFTVPLAIGGGFHMLFVRQNILPFLRVPIKTSWFGKNKTWRGVALMIGFTILGVWVGQWSERYLKVSLPYRLSDASFIALGLLLGAAFILGELPNSFVKRRLGIKPGQLPDRYKILTIIGDQMDSALPITLVYWIYFEMRWGEFVLLVLGVPFAFFLWRILLSILGLKSTPFQ